MIEICRDHSTNVKRWRDGTMALRWCAAGMVEHGARIGRKPLDHYGPPPKFHGTQAIPSA
jgi:hypothetical protein